MESTEPWLLEMLFQDEYSAFQQIPICLFDLFVLCFQNSPNFCMGAFFCYMLSPALQVEVSLHKWVHT